MELFYLIPLDVCRLRNVSVKLPCGGANYACGGANYGRTPFTCYKAL